MANPTVAPAPAKGQDLKVLLAYLKTPEMHPVAIALSKAEAVRWLLEELDTGELGELAQSEGDTLDWLREISLKDLAELLETARAEFVKAAELLQEVA